MGYNRECLFREFLLALPLAFAIYYFVSFLLHFCFFIALLRFIQISTYHSGDSIEFVSLGEWDNPNAVIGLEGEDRINWKAAEDNQAGNE